MYLKDVIVFSSSGAQHVRYLDEILGLVGKVGVTLKLEKCAVYKREVNYLYILSFREASSCGGDEKRYHGGSITYG